MAKYIHRYANEGIGRLSVCGAWPNTLWLTRDSEKVTCQKCIAKMANEVAVMLSRPVVHYDPVARAARRPLCGAPFQHLTAVIRNVTCDVCMGIAVQRGLIPKHEL